MRSGVWDCIDVRRVEPNSRDKSTVKRESQWHITQDRTGYNKNQVDEDLDVEQYAEIEIEPHVNKQLKGTEPLV